MAPELFEGARPGIKTDLYALGVVFLEALLAKSMVAHLGGKNRAATMSRCRIGIGRSPR